MLTPLDRAYTFGMCKAIVRGCTKANAQIDHNVLRRIQEVSNGLAAALMWYSEMEFVGANAIINADEKARIEAIAHANFETTDCLNVSVNVNADGMFKVISSDMAEMIFFEKVMTLTVSKAADWIVFVLKAMAKLKAIAKSYGDVVGNKMALTMAFGVALVEMNIAAKALFSKMDMPLATDWELVGAENMT